MVVESERSAESHVLNTMSNTQANGADCWYRDVNELSSLEIYPASLSANTVFSLARLSATSCLQLATRNSGLCKKKLDRASFVLGPVV